MNSRKVINRSDTKSLRSRRGGSLRAKLAEVRNFPRLGSTGYTAVIR